ncbi:hypothetical protein ACIQ9R_36170 [Streptomyces sp. NPDC094447]|uniref:hypothetical protein n=1 Tax=Streptomyces sp. NPDC094447 TaxID=3366062 RepID=UPI003826FF3D
MSTPTPGDNLISALAQRGVTAHRDGDSFIGNDRNSWLTLALAENTPPDMDGHFLLIYLADPDGGDEVTVDRPVEPGDHWLTVIGGAVDAPHVEVLGRTFPVADVATLAAYITGWRRDPARVLREAAADTD